jgi:simple sugar transport system permease protein
MGNDCNLKHTSRAVDGWQSMMNKIYASLLQLAHLFVPSVLALISATLIGAGFVSFFGHSPLQVFLTIRDGAWGDVYSLSETLLKTTPLIFTGLAVALAFRAGVWNIGVEGQFIVGALMGTALGVSATNLAEPVFLLVILLGAFGAGVFWGAIPGWLRQQHRVSEVITTIMLNVIALHVLSYAVHGPLQEVARTYPQSDRLVDAARLLQLWPGTRLHSGVIIAMLCASLLWLLLFRLPFGFRLRAIGQNPKAAHFAGIKVSPHVIAAIALSGGLAALGGAVEVAGVTGRLYENISPGYGYTGIAVAMLGRLHPLGVLPAAFLFGALESGGRALQRNLGISPVLAEAVQGAVILFVVLYETRWFRATCSRFFSKILATKRKV